MRLSLYIAICLLSASSSEATLFSRTATRIHHAAIKRSARLARDLRYTFNNVLIDQPIIGPDSGNRVYCVANPPANAQNPLSSSTVPSGGGNPVIVSSITSGSSSRRPTATSTSSGGSPTPTSNSPWALAETRDGASFFDGWDFWSEAGVFSHLCFFMEIPYSSCSPDPTHGALSPQQFLVFLLRLNYHCVQELLLSSTYRTQ